MIAADRLREYDLIESAWREWRDNAAYRGQSPDALPVRPPGWFKALELGFAWGEGPSLMWTCRSLTDDNRRAAAQLGREAPRKVTYPLARRRRRVVVRIRRLTYELACARVRRRLDDLRHLKGA